MRIKWGALLFFSLFMSGCGQDYPLVANGYSKTAELSALDATGLGNFAEPVEPKGCLLAFKSMPDLSTLQMRVVIAGEVDRTYNSRDLAQALSGEGFSTGVFVVDESGLKFQKGYECESETR